MRNTTAPSLLAALFIASSFVVPATAGAAEPPGSAAPTASGATTPQASADPAGRYIVLLRDGREPVGASRAIERRRGVRVERVFEHAIGGFSTRLTGPERAQLAKDPDVEAIVPDERISLEQVIPNGVRRIGTTLSTAADVDATDERVNADVAVVDTGIATHTDLNVVGGYDCSTSNRSAWRDLNGHGTHVAGTIAGKDKALGVVGVAPGARLWAVKILNDDGDGLLSWYICGLDWIAAQRDPAETSRPLIESVNMSVSKSGRDDVNCGYTNTDALHRAICRVTAAGITVVAAAGNQSTFASTRVPAAYNEVITVSALADTDGKPGGTGASLCYSWGGYDKDDTFADFSNYGSDVDLIAPGKCIWSTLPGGRYGYSSGTSMAAPHVAGAVALYKASRPWATPAHVKTALEHLASTNWNVATDRDATHERLLDVSRIGPWGDFSLALGAASSVVKESGGTVTLPVTVKRSASFFESVSLAVAVPKTFGGKLSATSLLGTTATASTLTVTVPASTLAGEYPVTISGTDGSGRKRTATGTLVVENDFPKAGAPSVTLVAGKTLGTTTTPVQVTWPAATDPTSAIGGYELSKSVAAGAWTTIGSYGATTRTAVVPLTTGASQQLRDRAKDVLGNWSPWVAGTTFRTALTQNSSSAFRYTTGWRRVSSANASGGSVTYSTTAGARARVAVTGKEIALVMPVGPSRGSFRVYVDGASQGVFSSYRASGNLSRQIVWRMAFGTSASRMVEIRNMGTAGHSRVDLDAVLVLR
jgi:subtilisin family serine protease